MYSCYHSSPKQSNCHPSWQCHAPIGSYSTVLPASPIRNNESGLFQSLKDPFYKEPFDRESIMNECKRLIVNAKILNYIIYRFENLNLKKIIKNSKRSRKKEY